MAFKAIRMLVMQLGRMM